ncbi:hypothetical protein NA57DRAFT_81417 [Rhizodiscina lignyota]|uniref:Heterokaryon incompatibility domain-containing protein n=1 Tax=Rhizodiscina lignyota TaxID=1504668 RepID=A0A9P4M549_9PEZI|nr:hypothetical protein NA57DRAFT_81417 [Rhizodiscina lignyota]
MGEIYKAAVRVLIHVGPDVHGDAHLAIESVQKLIHLIHEYGPEVNLKINDPESEFASLNWEALDRMTRMPWFSRAWTVQEVGLADEAVILYGEHRLDWRDLMEVLYFFGSHKRYALRIENEYRDVPRLTSGVMWRSYDISHRQATEWMRHSEAFLFALDCARQKYKASNPRDYIYAFLAHPLLATTIHPDYTKSIEDVYLDFAISWLQTRQTLNLLSFAGVCTGDAPESKCPSWCPQWNETQQSKLQPNSPFRESPRRKPGYHFSIRDRTELHAQGFKLGTVSHVSASIRRNDVFVREPHKRSGWETKNPFIDTLRRLHREEFGSSVYDDLLESLALTMIAQFAHFELTDVKPCLIKWIQEFEHLVSDFDKDSLPAEIQDEVHPSPADYSHFTLRAAQG